MKTVINIGLTALMVFVIGACGGKDSGVKSVKIGTQTWMAENLNDASKGGKCYEDKHENCEKYGRLYDWGEAMEACPEGWHLPSNDEWQTLVNFAGGENVAGKKLKTKSGWNNNGNGTDDYGFSALPGGEGYLSGSFNNVGFFGYWWGSSEYDASIGYDQDMFSIFSSVDEEEGIKRNSYSVRCIKNKEGEQQADQQPAKEKFRSVKIGTQVWMAENLNDASKGGKCYEDKPENCEKYGRLYTWEDALKACPSGWHLPSDEEWQTLDDFVGNKESGTKLKAKSGWNKDDKGKSGNGTDEYGFSALPGGNTNENGGFSDVGNTGYWWSSEERYDFSAFSRYITNYGSILFRDRDGDSKTNLLSVRCVKD